MFDPDQYQLLDFGHGRKLERFGAHVIDRPAPAADMIEPATPAAWKKATLRFRRERGNDGAWHATGELPEKWSIHHDGCQLELRPTPFGHVGLFPEQAACWDWITRRVARARSAPRVLNLFAYTGGSTLAAAAAGAEVVHVDAAKNVVAWARRNAQQSALDAAPIRWIVEDATAFVRREVRRGNRYDALVLDPPSYGHGPKAESWKIERHLPPLLVACRDVLAERPAFILLTCHSPGFGPAELEALLADTVFGSCQGGVVATQLALSTDDGRRLACGTAARWPG